MPLIDELISGPQKEQQGGSLADKLTPLSTGTPLEDFVITLMSMADDKGVLDSAFSGQGPSVEDQVDNVSSVEDQDFVSKEEMAVLVEKFIVLPPDQQQMILDGVKQESPKIAQQMLAAVRLVKGRDGTK